MSKPRIAVVGIGRLGSFHTKLVNAGNLFELVAIVEPVESARHVATHEFSVRGVADISEIVDEIDCAIIATPTICHYAVAQKLLKSIKPGAQVAQLITPERVFLAANRLIDPLHPRQCTRVVPLDRASRALGHLHARGHSGCRGGHR